MSTPLKKYKLLLLITFFSTFLFAQVQVRDEPRHHNVFENDLVRILDVYLAPGDTTQYHLHNTPSVFIVLSDTKVGSQIMGKEPQDGANINGDISYDSLNTPRLHHVWNKDTGWFHVMDVELTSKSYINFSPIKNPSLSLLFNEKQVIGYKMQLKDITLFQLPASEKGYLLVSMGNTSLNYSTNNNTQHRIMKAGHYIWVEPGKAIKIKVTSKTNTEFALLQFK